MLRLENVSDTLLQDLSFAIKAGESAKIVVSSDELKNSLRALLLGWTTPHQGRVRLFGVALDEAGEDARLVLYRRVGTVLEDGGLISNLKVWENILLPASFHTGMSVLHAERPVTTFFRAFGYTDDSIELLMGRLPDGLSPLEKRLVALARARLMDPDLMIYDFPFSGLAREAAGLLLEQTRDYHGEKRGRASLYLLPDDAQSARVKTDFTLSLH